MDSDLVVSESLRFCDQYGLLQSEQVLLEKYAQKDAYILDALCGVGRVTFGLKNLGYKNVVGADYAHKQFLHAKAKGCKNFKRGLFNQFLMRDKFDVIIYPNNSFMKLPGACIREKELKQITKLLKKGGLLIINCWDREKMHGFKKFFEQEKLRWEEGKTQNGLIDFGDILRPNPFTQIIHVPNESEMQELFKRCKLNILEIVSKESITDEKNLKRENMQNSFYYVVRK